jgi:hypothetical protein
MTSKELKDGPQYDPWRVNRQYEERLYDYYGRPKYWEWSGTGPGSSRNSGVS